MALRKQVTQNVNPKSSVDWTLEPKIKTCPKLYNAISRQQPKLSKFAVALQLKATRRLDCANVIGLGTCAAKLERAFTDVTSKSTEQNFLVRPMDLASSSLENWFAQPRDAKTVTPGSC